MTTALISASLVSCEREADMLIDEMEQQQALAMLDTDALRSMKPIYNGKPANITHEGEKGRDRRDNMGNDRMKIKYSAMTEMKVGDIYVTGYDESTDEYTAEIYWGEELDEEMKKMFEARGDRGPRREGKGPRELKGPRRGPHGEKGPKGGPKDGGDAPAPAPEAK